MICALFQAVIRYIVVGFAVVPVAPGTKKPQVRNWTELRISQDEVPAYFKGNCNVGLILGAPSNGLTDVDLDCREVLMLASTFLPPTEMVHGRLSKPESHYWYQCTPCPKYLKFEDVDGSCILEIRADGHQTVVPPSSHPTGEILQWVRSDPPSHVTADDLTQAAARLAAACLLARHWPEKGSRNEAAMALSGALLRSGWDRAQTEEFVTKVAGAAGDEEAESRGTTAGATDRRLATQGDATGWPRLEQLFSAEVVAKVRGWLGTESAYEVVELQSTRKPWPAPIGTQAYYGIIGKIVSMMAPHTEADPAALMVQLIVALGNVIGRNAYLQVGADKHYCNLFFVLVGVSSKGRKGTSLSEIRKVLQSVDEDWEKHLPSGLSSGEGLIWAVRDPITKTKPIREKGRVVDYEEIIEDRGVGDKRLLVLEQEFVSVLEAMRREGNTLSPLVREAWDRGNLRSLVKNSPARATNAHISIIAHITQDELISKLDGISMKNGLANRFLWAVVRRSQLLPFGGRAFSPNASVFKELARILSFCEQPRALTWAEGAAEHWSSVYPQIASERSGLAGEATSRAEAQIVRIASIYAISDCSESIRKPHLDAALEIWRYCEESANYIFGSSLGNAVADAILAELRRRPEGMRRTDVNYYLGHNKYASEITRALELLLTLQLAVCIQRKTGGRPEQRWYAKEHWDCKKQTKKAK